MRVSLIALTLPALLLATACQSGGHARGDAAMHHDGYSEVETAVAVMQPTAGNQVGGTVALHQRGDSVKVVAHIHGLSPNSTHAIHIHEYGDARAADGTSAGGHYNPAGHEHGLPDQAHRHAGDLGNLMADKQGKATFEITVDNMSLHGAHPVLGRSVIIHAKQDDGGQPTGNAGPRIAIGVIGVANPSAGK